MVRIIEETAVLESTLPNISFIKTNDKADEEFRIYDVKSSPVRVVEHYRDMRRFQTIEFYKKMEMK